MIRHAAHPLVQATPICGEPGWFSDPDQNLARPGQVINCPQCRAVIVWAKGIKQFHEPPADYTAATREAFEG